MKKVLTFIFAITCLAGTYVVASSPQDKKEHGEATTALTEVKVCPMTGEAVEGEGAGSEVVGKYKVYFCCSGCKAGFAKLSPEKKEEKVAAAVKKQEESKKKS